MQQMHQSSRGVQRQTHQKGKRSSPKKFPCAVISKRASKKDLVVLPRLSRPGSFIIQAVAIVFKVALRDAPHLK